MGRSERGGGGWSWKKGGRWVREWRTGDHKFQAAGRE